MLRIIDKHAIHALLEAGQSTRQVAHQLGVSRRTVQRVAQEPPVEDADDAEVRRRRSIGLPGVSKAALLQRRDFWQTILRRRRWSTCGSFESGHWDWARARSTASIGF